MLVEWDRWWRWNQIPSNFVGQIKKNRHCLLLLFFKLCSPLYDLFRFISVLFHFLFIFNVPIETTYYIAESDQPIQSQSQPNVKSLAVFLCSFLISDFSSYYPIFEITHPQHTQIGERTLNTYTYHKGVTATS